jgi:two-component sensor histidine kinase/CheY-like chemotaxis protein
MPRGRVLSREFLFPKLLTQMDSQITNILLIEDNEAHAELLSRNFEKHADRFRVTIANSLKDAESYLGAGSIVDLVITDMLLPDGRGIELLQKESGMLEIPVIVMTSHGNEEMAVQAMKLGALDYIVKSDSAFSELPRTADRALREWNHIIKRKQAEQRITESNSRMMTILDSIPADVYVSDMDTYEILYMNEQMKASFGRDLTGQICWNAFRGKEGPCQDCTNADLLDENNQPTHFIIWEDLNPLNKRYYLNHDKAILWIDDRYVRIQISIDITKRRHSEELIRSSLKEKETLIQEIHHRVKNNMQVIASLLKLQSSKMEDGLTKKTLQDSQNRVYALSAVHEILHKSDNLSEIDLKSYIVNIAGALIQSFQANPENIRLNVDCSDIKLNIEKASPLGLVINELVSNALKYAFPEGRKGEISIEVRNRNGELELILMDDGVGMDKEFDWKNSNTLGLQLVSVLTKDQLDGSIDVKREHGTQFIIRFRIDD